MSGSLKGSLILGFRPRLRIKYYRNRFKYQTFEIPRVSKRENAYLRDAQAHSQVHEASASTKLNRSKNLPIAPVLKSLLTTGVEMLLSHLVHGLQLVPISRSQDQSRKEQTRPDQNHAS